MGGCAAYNCTNSSKKGFRLFKFPADPVRSRKWAINCGRKYWIPTRSSLLCSAHFDDSQFENRRQDGWKKLKWNAIPTIFNLPNYPDKSNIENESVNENCNFIPKVELNEVEPSPDPLEDVIENEVQFLSIPQFMQCHKCSILQEQLKSLKETNKRFRSDKHKVLALQERLKAVEDINERLRKENAENKCLVEKLRMLLSKEQIDFLKTIDASLELEI